MDTAAGHWVGLLVDQKFEIHGAATRASEIAGQLAKTDLREGDGNLVAELELRERKLRAIKGNLKAEEVAEIIARVVADLSARTRDPWDVAMLRFSPALPPASDQGHLAVILPPREMATAAKADDKYVTGC